MNVEKLTMDKAEAKKLYAEYRANSAYLTKDDQAIAAIYKRIAAGKLVIRALASITAAGLDRDGMPKLAIARADRTKVQCELDRDAVVFRGLQGTKGRMRTSYAVADTFNCAMPGCVYVNYADRNHRRVADVPLIPVHLRPRKALDKYAILWEADWYRYPVDPYLLRRCGQDAWIVVAAWDLTAVERAVMSSRLNA